MTTAVKTNGSAPMVQSEPTPWEKLRAPFPPEKIGHLPKGGVELSYIGHADVTDRLLAVDPYWNWEPLAFNENGLPKFVLNEQDKPVGLWIKLTIHGDIHDAGAQYEVTRLGYGSVSPTAFDPEKQLIGDALRNAAMRFGVGLDLWRKEEVAPAENASAVTDEVRRVFTPASPQKPVQATTAPPGRSQPLGPCEQCVEDGVVAPSGKPSMYWPPKKAGYAPQCNGFRDGVYLNHRMPQEPVGAMPAVSAFADGTPLPTEQDIPW